MDCLPRDVAAVILLLLPPSAFASVARASREWQRVAEDVLREWVQPWKEIRFGSKFAMRIENECRLPRWEFCKQGKVLMRVGARELSNEVQKTLKISIGMGKTEWVIVSFDRSRNFASVLHSEPDGAWVRREREREKNGS